MSWDMHFTIHCNIIINREIRKTILYEFNVRKFARYYIAEKMNKKKFPR